MKQENSKLDSFSASKILRRCGQLGIPYEKVISSQYGKSKGWRLGNFRNQYRDGKLGTIGWGEKKAPHSGKRLYSAYLRAVE